MKSSLWACILYPESCVNPLIPAIRNTHISMALSPLHDQDCDQDSGALIKPHFHLLMRYAGPISRDTAADIFRSLGGVGCEQVLSLRGYFRYLTHMDNPDKFRYDDASVMLFNDFKYYLKNDTDFKLSKLTKLCNWLRKYKIYDLSLAYDIICSQDCDFINTFVTYHRFILSYVKSMLCTDRDKILYNPNDIHYEYDKYIINSEHIKKIDDI